METSLFCVVRHNRVKTFNKFLPSAERGVPRRIIFEKTIICFLFLKFFPLTATKLWNALVPGGQPYYTLLPTNNWITLPECGENIRLEINNFWRFYICGLHPDALNLDSWTQKFAVIAFNIFITNGSNKTNAPNKGIWERIEILRPSPIGPKLGKIWNVDMF